MAGGRFHYDPSNRCVPGVKDVIETLEQGIGLRCASFHNGYALRVQVERNESSKNLRGMSAYLRWLDDHAVASREGCHEWHQRELNGIIPGRDDQNNAERLAHDKRLSRHQSDRVADSLRSTPPRELFPCRSRSRADKTQICDPGLGAALAEVLTESVI